MNLSNLLIPSESTLKEALMVIDKEASGICFIIKGTTLLGVLTDGDIRRALLGGKDLSSPVSDCMNSEYCSLSVGATIFDIQKMLRVYKCVPILDDKNNLVDIATSQKYHQIPLVQPIFDGNELEYITDCIQTGWISSQGKYVRKFEEDFQSYIGANYSLAVSNGTVALHLALLSFGIGEGDEVIVPDLTFAAPVNAVIYTGANPVLVDIDPITLTIKPESILSVINSRTRAIIPVHLYGHPANMRIINDIAKRYKLIVIEDCAEALGSKFDSSYVGSIGDASIFSFFGNKTLTTGEGGMVLFKDKNIFEKAKLLRDHGMSPTKRYWHEQIGFNYRMTNIQAAIGVAQMEKISHFVNKKRELAEKYSNLLSGIDAIKLPQETGDVINTYWLYTIIMDSKIKKHRDDLINYLKAFGIESRPVFYPIHRMPPYKNLHSARNNFPESDAASDGGISLPSSLNLTDNDIDKICSVVKNRLCDYVIA